MNRILIKGSPGSGKTVLARAFAYYYCLEKLGLEEAFRKEFQGDRDKIESFVDSDRCEFIQVHSSMGYEDLVCGPEIKAGGSLQVACAGKRVKKICDRAREDKARGRDDLYCIIFDDMGRTDGVKLLGNILYAMEYRNEPVELPNGTMLTMPENVVIVFTECTGIAEHKLDYALRRRIDYIHEIHPDASFLEHYYETVNEKVRDSIVGAYRSVLSFLEKHCTDEGKGSCRNYNPGQGMFMVERAGTAHFVLDSFKQKLICQISPYIKSLYAGGMLKSDPEDLLRSLVSSINTGAAGLNRISAIRKIMAKAGTYVKSYSLQDTVGYYRSTIIPNQCSDYKGILESVIDAIVLNQIFPYDLASNMLLTNVQVAAIPSKSVPRTYGSYLVRKDKAADYYYESARAGKSRVSHAYYSTNAPNVGRWVGNRDVAAYEFAYADGTPNEIFLPLNGMRLHVFTVENVCKADNPAEIYGAVYRLVYYYLTSYERSIALTVNGDKNDFMLDQLLKLEIRYLETVHKELKNVVPPSGMPKDRAKMLFFGTKLLQLRCLWNLKDTCIEVDETKFHDLAEGRETFTLDAYEAMYDVSPVTMKIPMRGVVKMTDLKDYQRIMENIGVRQMIFQGPPGTSKTFESKKFVLSQLDGAWADANMTQEQISNGLEPYKLTQEDYDNPAESSKILTGGWDLVQFHPSYGYEDFIRGIEVSATDSGLPSYRTVNRILGKIAEFAKIAEKANAHSAGASLPPKFYLVIDEINRANLATVFGELIYGLEYRDSKVSTPYEVEDKAADDDKAATKGKTATRDKAKTKDIVLGKNLYIIGTMNTADKSIDSIDYAIRRRFLFIDSPADRNVVKTCYQNISGKADEESIELFLFDAVQKLFDGEVYFNDEYQRNDVKLGHTYFLRKSAGNYLEDIVERFVFQIIPILREYVKDGILDALEDLAEREHRVSEIAAAATRGEKILLASDNIMLLAKEFGSTAKSGEEINNEYVGRFLEQLAAALGY